MERSMRPLLPSCKLLLPLLASSLCFAAQADRISGPIDSGQTVVLARSVHPKAQPQYDQGPVDPAMKLTYMTMLTSPSPAQQAALDLLLAQQQDRTSPNYHKWLTPQQFADQFGLSENDLNKVTAWLTSEGFQILTVGGGRNSVSFSGTAAQVQHAFGAEIHNYTVNGKQHVANSTPLLIPAALNGVVRTVTGVHNFLPHPASRIRVPVNERNPHHEYYNSTFGNLLAPGDIATFYGLNALFTGSPIINGAGQELAIVGQTDVYVTDIADFRTGFSLGSITGCTLNGNQVITACDSTYFKYVLAPGSTDPGVVYNCGDLGESDLDIEWSGAAAPGAQIVFVNSPVSYPSGCNGNQEGGGVNASLNAVINPPSGPPLAHVVSMSYGICELEADDLETLLQQGNAEGVTIMNSAGDVGAAVCDYNPPDNEVDPPFGGAVGGLAVSYPASSPEVTGVGGTEISIANDFPPSSYWGTSNGPTGGTVLSYIPEIAWNDDVELAQYCQQYYSGNSFCMAGGSPAVPHWVPLDSAATAEQVQQDIWISEGSGGASNCFSESAGVCTGGFPQPSYQDGLSLADAPAGVRWVPDVSIMASPNFPGYIFCTAVSPTVEGSTCAGGIPSAIDNYTSIIGGTSASSPIFAGIVTLMNQYLDETGQGNINSTLYALAKNTANGAFHQVTTGDNAVYCAGGEPSNQPAGLQCPGAAGTVGTMGYQASNADSTTGYNLVTGLGSVNASALAAAWFESVTPDFQLSATGLNPSSISAGNQTSSTITISPLTTGSTATVVNFSSSSCSGLPSGATCSFNPVSVPFDGTDPVTTVVTITTPPTMAAVSAQTITISAVNYPETTTTVSLTVTATTESFTIAPTNGTTFTTTAGGTQQVQIAVTSASSPSFIVGSGAGATTAVQVTYTCTGSPNLATAEITCTAPNNGQPTNATAVTVTLQTTGATTQLRRPFGGSRLVYAFLLPGLFGIFFAAGPRRRGVRLLSMIVVLGCCTLGVGSCGGNSGGGGVSNPGTPAGNYTVTINATTGGAVPLTASTTFTLSVSQ
jgi:subtilase family serine protease